MEVTKLGARTDLIMVNKNSYGRTRVVGYGTKF